MPVRSEQLAIGYASVAHPGNQVVYTCPAGKTTIVKSIAIGHPHSAPERLQVLLVDSGVTAVVPLVDRLMGVNEAWHLELWVVMQPGDALYVQRFAGNAGFHWFVISGAELDG